MAYRSKHFGALDFSLQAILTAALDPAADWLQDQQSPQVGIISESRAEIYLFFTKENENKQKQFPVPIPLKTANVPNSVEQINHVSDWPRITSVDQTILIWVDQALVWRRFLDADPEVGGRHWKTGFWKPGQL